MNFLDIPTPTTRRTYARNLIQVAVCELRFPSLLDVERGVPAKFEQAIKSEFPRYEKRASVDVDLLRASTKRGANAHTFQSKDKKWIVTLRPSSLVLETVAYSRFEDFAARHSRSVGALKKILEADFVTRVGLRYVNGFPRFDDLDGWLNPELGTAILSGQLGNLSHAWQIAQGQADERTHYILQHGLQQAVDGHQRYMVDIDSYIEDVDLLDIARRLGELHALVGRIFEWAIGSRAREYMSTQELLR